VELHPSDPEWMLCTLVRPGDEAVERHRDAQPHIAHRSAPSWSSGILPTLDAHVDYL
jgi:hypothetical protein